MAHAWWQTGVIYQVYPRSFLDSNGDGVGDLEGLRRRLDYIAALGVGAVWVSPFFPSPMADFGYDVADYCDVDPLFGTLADCDHLIHDAHARGLKIILDFVPNHTSDQHPWFRESRASRTNARRDWYIWRDPAPDGGPPNNWGSQFGGSGWTFDETTGQYYAHAFLKAQPDLNWRNPAVRDAMYDVLRFWMRRGVDGFRIDVLWHLMKDPELRDNPANPDWQPGMADILRTLRTNSCDHPDIMDVARQLRRVADEFPDRVLIGELYRPLERLMDYYGAKRDGVQLPFNFHLMDVDWQPRSIADLVERYERLLPPDAWPNWVLGNHDQSRIATRVGAERAPLAMMLLLTLRGTPTIYQGDELGLEDADIPLDRIRDPWAINEPGIGGRDPERSPMPWDGSLHAGFSPVEPWLPLSREWQTQNVVAQSADPRSLLQLTRDLLVLRKKSPALSVGDYQTVLADDRLYAFERVSEGEVLRVVLNFSDAPVDLPAGPRGSVLLSTHRNAGEVGATLLPFEGIVLRLEA